MSTTSPAGPDEITTTAGRSPLLKAAVAGAGVAALVNAALWAAGRAADVSFLVSQPQGEEVDRVGVAMVVSATLVAFAIAWGLLALAARRSRRWVRAVLATAALVAVVSSAGPLAAADDTATGLLLAAMHVVTGGTFLVTAIRSGAR
jgi:hypothetical protein